MLAVVEAAKTDPKVKAAFTAGTKESDELVVKPLFQFRNCGQQLPHYWSTISKNPPSARTAIRAPPSPSPTSWSTRPTRPNTIIRTSTHPARLNSANRYTVTFPKDGTPPVYGFWSLSIYNEHHFFVANVINRFSVGTKNKDLKLQHRRFAHDLRTGRRAERCGPARQLDARAPGRLFPLRARLLAEGGGYRRHLNSARSRKAQ